MSVDVFFDGLNELLADWKDGVGALGADMKSAVSAGCADGKATGRKLADRGKTGALAKSVHGAIVTSDSMGAEGELTATLVRASWFQDGTKAHIISPKPGGVLRFEVGGQAVYTRKPINHPGTKKTPFMDEAEKVAVATIESRVASAVEKLEARMK